MDRANQGGEEILAAAITLRDSSGRDRNQALKTMATTWHIARYENIHDKSRGRNVSALVRDIEAAVRDAALKWECDPLLGVPDSQTRGVAEHVDTPAAEISQSTGAKPSSRVDEGVAVNKR